MFISSNCIVRANVLIFKRFNGEDDEEMQKSTKILMVLIVVLLVSMGFALRFFLFRPRFRVFDVSVSGSQVTFQVQNVGWATAHSISVTVDRKYTYLLGNLDAGKAKTVVING